MKRILYFVQLPPPIHGVSTMNKCFTESKIINEGFVTHVLEIKFSDNIANLQKVTIGKLFKAIVLAFKLFIEIIRFKPDFIYFTIMPVGKGIIRDLIFVIIIKLFKAKPIYHLRNQGVSKAKKSIVFRKMFEFIFNNSIVIHLSEGLMEKEINFLNLKNTETYIVNNGVELIDNIISEKNNPTVNLLFLSNLFPEKGLNYLVEAVKTLNKKKYNFKLNIVGSLRDNINLKDILKDNDSNNINFIGELFNSERNNYFRNADIFVHPTINDSFPLVILEAMQFGLPIISTFEGAIPEMVDNGITGIIVEKGNVNQLTESIELLLNNKDLRIQMGQNGRKKYLDKYTRTKCEENMRIVFNKISS